MIYVIRGSEQYFIEEKVKEICLDTTEVIKYDGSSKDFDVFEMLDNCTANSLFADKITIAVKDPYFLIKKTDEKIANAIMDYVHNPLYETDLVFYTLDDSFNTKLKLFKDICENADLMVFDSFDYKNFNNYVIRRLNEKNIKLSKDCQNQLIAICKKDATLFNKNLELLCLYPDNIDSNVINKLCTSSDDNISFDLINAITNKDISKAIQAERRLLKDNETVGIINLLASQLRTLYTIAYLKENNYKKTEIMKEINYTEYRLNLALDTLNKLSKNKIIEMLHELSQLDIMYKTDNSISDVSRFELFILGMLKNASN